MPFEFHSYGCKVNSYDTGLIEGQLVGIELSEPVHILNTCAVTKEASKEAVKQIRRIKAKQPLATVLVTGCAAQVDTDMFSDLTVADLVVANSHKSQMGTILKTYFRDRTKRVYKSDIFKKMELEAGGGLNSTRTRSFLKVQDGCNSFCTYCVIPFARGKSRSIPISEIIDQVLFLKEKKVLEVVLTGIHLGDYQDHSNGLEDLVENLVKFTSGVRFRISSLEPQELSPRLLELFTADSICPHFHMSIQSGEDQVLNDMKRKYGAKEVENVLNAIFDKLPNAFVGMDVIAGFPTESDESFDKTLNLLRNTPWTRIHSFPYSERPGTYAARLKVEVPLHIRKQRSKVLRELSQNRYQMRLSQQVGTTKNLLLLNSRSHGCNSLSEDYWPVELIDGSNGEFPNSSTIQDSNANPQFINAKITDLDAEGRLLGVAQ